VTTIRIFAAILFSVLGLSARAQNNNTDVDTKQKTGYATNKRLPAFNILLRDSTNVFNTFNIPKGRPTILLLFSPDCKHCNEAAEKITKGMDSIKDYDIYFISSSPRMGETIKYAQQHQLDEFENIKQIGSDVGFFYVPFYGTRHLPGIAIYNKNKEFVKYLEGDFELKDIRQ
jgi:hypothetical protein